MKIIFILQVLAIWVCIIFIHQFLVPFELIRTQMKLFVTDTQANRDLNKM